MECVCRNTDSETQPEGELGAYRAMRRWSEQRSARSHKRNDAACGNVVVQALARME
jgi:hypothetical protein